MKTMLVLKKSTLYEIPLICRCFKPLSILAQGKKTKVARFIQCVSTRFFLWISIVLLDQRPAIQNRTQGLLILLFKLYTLPLFTGLRIGAF